MEKMKFSKNYKYILMLMAITLLIWYFWPESQEDIIRKNLHSLAKLCSFSKKPTLIQMGITNQRLDSYFTSDVKVNLQAKSKTYSVRGLSDVKSKYAFSAKFLDTLRIEFKDIQFSEIKHESAMVSCTVFFSAQGEGESYEEYQEIKVGFKRIEKSWMIFNLERVEVIK